MTYSEFKYFLETGRISPSYLDYLASKIRKSVCVNVPIVNHKLEEKIMVEFEKPKLSDEPWLVHLFIVCVLAVAGMVWLYW